MSDITDTTDLGDGYDQPNEAVRQGVEQEEREVDHGTDDHPGEHWTDLKFVYLALMYFMHLKFDNRLFSLMFYMGLGLAVGVYVIAMMTFQFFNP